MRAATYARVSTQEQADTGTSLDTQRDRTRAYVDAQGWELVAEYVDEGVSGAADRRPDLDRLMGECRDGNVDVIVVAKLDRFTRSSRHLANAMAELEDLGVGFASLAESVDSTTASGRMFRTLLGAFAEFERERITERMMEGHRRIIEAGGWTGGPPPFGYRAVSSGTMKKLALDDGGEAETVRLAVSMVVDQGCSAYEAAKRLNALGKGPRRAARWSHQNLRRVLLDETIAGRWKWGKQSDRVETVTVPIPPIIDVDRFDDLQRVLALTATGPQERRPRLSSHRPCQLSMWLHFHRSVAEGSAPPLLSVPQQQTSIQRRSYRAMWLSESCGRRYRDRGVGDDRQRVVRT